MTKPTITQADRNAVNHYMVERARLAFNGTTGPHADLLLQSFATHREAELDAIVDFLQEQAGIAAVKAEEAVAPPENERLARDLFAAKISLERAAKAIDRGGHHD